MSESALAGKVLLGILSVEPEKLDASVDCVFINDLHIVILRLAHLNAVKSGQIAKQFDIMIASAAEMHSTAVLSKQLAVVWHSEFAVKIALEVHRAIIAEHYRASMP